MSGNPEIKRWDDDDVIIPVGKYSSLKEAVEKEYANLRSANLRYANLSSANLRYADLSSANLRYADLSYANLSYANLRSADLSSANLRYADLSSANLRYADLSSAKGINKYLTTPLYMLLDQEGLIRAYKIVNGKNEGIYNGGLIYEIGKTLEVKDVDIDENNSCGKGINLATLDWCIKEYKEGYKILIAEFKKEDIACIPIGSDGKFRVHRCKIVGEKDLKKMGIRG